MFQGMQHFKNDVISTHTVYTIVLQIAMPQ